MRPYHVFILGCVAALPAGGRARAEMATALPDIDVTASRPEQTPAAELRPLAEKTQALDQARANIPPPLGVSAYSIGAAAIAQSPQGDNAPLNQVLLQAPGVSQDSAASGLFHVRNEHANAQYRVNGVMLPEGVSGFGVLLDTRFVGGVSLLTGALPAQFGLHTSGIVDVVSKNGVFDGGGSIGVYGGSHGTITPSFEYGGTSGQTQYFVTGNFLQSNLGIENTTPALNAIHDRNQLSKFFGYVSTILDDGSRLSFMTGSAIGTYQIPATPGQTPFPGVAALMPFSAYYPSSAVAENQYEASLYNVLAWQKSIGALDFQVAYFSRYSAVHFMPDTYGDLLYNGVASDVLRDSFLNGVNADAAYRYNEAHTIRGGFYGSGEETYSRNASFVFATGADSNPYGSPFPAPVDQSAKFGWLLGAYIQDEWRISRQLTLNAGIRFDQMVQYVDGNQFSPRISLTYAPLDGTNIHAGFARYFTPPSQALSAAVNLGLFSNTTAAPAVTQSGSVLPERGSYVDVGIDQKVLPGLTLGIDGYLKWAKDLLDDGQFGQALVLTAFNYAKGYNQGLEFKFNYEQGDFRAYGNLALAKQMATNVVSNQYLFDPDELAFISTHNVYTDHSQTLTASAGASYLWNGLRFSADMIYGGGMRAGFANTATVAPYVQVNAGVMDELKFAPDMKPLTLRFDVVNLFDTIYQIRDGSGIGVFAPQYGPRRGFFIGISQKI
ncbi:TonB-dependent receptor [Rhodoblastus sp. 17X3]|uniref:TonB-dependent receptor n=1 Tax=Rhodoblastus sp. 17X3 TaxID=3047026 RepID=UPI0024B73CF4|nr:TonB-dependent receptor [Rhodoblastus sp. 17X3]MDI9849606.1 TonB-dependent receptor [Rhodoblastus sp. 17X3]